MDRQRRHFNHLAVLAAASCVSPHFARAQARTVPLKFIQAGQTLTYVPQLYAIATGMFKSAGLEVEYLPIVQNSQAVAQAVISGQANIASFGTTAVVSAVGANQDLVSIAILASKPTMAMALTKKTVAQLAAKGITPASPIKDRVAALKGLTIGSLAPGSSTDLVVRNTLTQFGVNPDRDVTMRPFSTSSSEVAAARAGAVDGYAAPIPDSMQLVPDGSGTVWINYARGDVARYADYPYTAIVTSRAFIDKNADTLRPFVRALWQAVDELKANPTKVKTVVKEQFFKEMDPKLYDVAFDACAPAFSTLTTTPQGFEEVIRDVAAGSTKPISVSASQVWDARIAQEART